jgi:hypothetical protein
MKSFRLIVLFVFIGSSQTFAQSLSRVTSGIDLGLGYQEEQWVPTIMYHQELSLANFQWFRIGWGVRTWGYYAGRTNLLPKDNAVSRDTLEFGKLSANGASFILGANVRLWRFDIGANTDIFGIAFGLRRNALYTKPTFADGEGAEYYNAYVKSNPATVNLLPLVMENQTGQSEIFLRYWITDRIGLKLGYTHGRITYAAEAKLDNGQKRFSKSYGVPHIAIAFPLYN